MPKMQLSINSQMVIFVWFRWVDTSSNHCKHCKSKIVQERQMCSWITWNIYIMLCGVNDALTAIMPLDITVCLQRTFNQWATIKLLINIALLFSTKNATIWYMAHCYIYTVSQKKFPPLNSLQLCQILTNFQNFYSAGKHMKFATKPIHNYPPHLRHVATLPWEIEN